MSAATDPSTRESASLGITKPYRRWRNVLRSAQTFEAGEQEGSKTVQNVSQDANFGRESADHLPSSGPSLRSILFGCLMVYTAMVALLCVSHRAQTYLIYLHWLRPPHFLFPLDRLEPYRLGSSARLISQNHLRGWHLLPPGPPFTDGTDADFDRQLAQSEQRVILFFHGNSGTRACPSKRVDLIRLLCSHLQAHVITFDYSGFGDSGGRPSEDQLNLDARAALDWTHARVAHDSDVIVYGQSLGTFAAVDLAAHLGDKTARTGVPTRNVSAVLLDAPPSSLVDASMTHPVTLPFRIIPNIRQVFRAVLRESLDSTEKIRRIRVPMLIMHGEEDRMITMEQGERLYNLAVGAGVQDVEFVRFVGSGHNSIGASPEYLRVVHAFLDKHLGAPCQHRW